MFGFVTLAVLQAKGPEIWEVRWHVCYRRTQDGRLVSLPCTLIVAENVRTGEVKFFVSNRVPGRGGWTLRELLRVAFGRWKVEACFREAKEELGWDHFECRGWGCVHRQRRNAEASRCHRKKRIADYLAMGIDPDRIKSVEPKSP